MNTVYLLGSWEKRRDSNSQIFAVDQVFDDLEAAQHILKNRGDEDHQWGIFEAPINAPFRDWSLIQ